MATAPLILFPSHVKAVNPDGTLTWEFLNAMNGVLRRLGGVDGSGSGGGSGTITPAPGGIVIPDFIMYSDSPSTGFQFPDTNPNDWNNRAGQMVVQIDFESNGYFAQNPNSHTVVGLRLDTVNLALGDPRFGGLVLGNVSTSLEGAQHYPTTQIEVRATGLEPPGSRRYLLPNSDGPSSKPLIDGVKYRVKITYSLSGANERRLSYQLWRAHPTLPDAWDIEVDTGPMLDPNPYIDMTQQGLAFVCVVPDVTTPGAWDIEWTNGSVTWLGIDEPGTDASARVSRYDALVEGNLEMVGTGRKVRVYSEAALANFSDWTQFMTSVLNGATTLLVVPNGTSGIANTIYTNKSNLSGSFSSLGIGTSGTDNLIESFAVGVTTPPIGFKVAGTTALTIKTTGFRLVGATEDCGPAAPRLATVTATGDANALAFTQTGAVSMAVYTAPGNISAAYTAAGGGAAGVEQVLRPLAAVISSMHAVLRSRGAL